MDVTQVLEGTLSPDATVRSNAEQQLNQAAEANFSEYLTTLAQGLANEQAPPHIRTAAGIALKNSFTARDYQRLQQVQQQWTSSVDPQTKETVKQLALQTLESKDARAGQSAAQFIASIAAIELPQQQWTNLMEQLVRNVSSPDVHTKIASLTTIGFICDDPPMELIRVLNQSSNAILTAVVQGARKEEPSEDVRLAAVTALSDSLQFVGQNFQNDGERNYIMQVVCEATQAEDSRIQEGAWGCLTRIMGLYYPFMRFYMEKALFGLTIQGMKSSEEDVAKLAIEFWATVCEEEQSIKDDNEAAREVGSNMRTYYSFAEIATSEVVPVLLELMTQQDEDAADDEYNVSRAAYQCLQLWAMTTQNHVMKPVISFVEANLRTPDWHKRDAAVSAFGAIMEGPDGSQMDVLVKQALPVVIELMNDENIHVKDSTAYTLGRICECCPGAVDENLLTQLIGALFSGLNSNPKMASSCCWALMSLGTQFGGQGTETNPLSPHFKEMVSHLLQLTERHDADNTLRTAAYEVLNTFITYAGNDVITLVAELSDVILKRLENTIGMQGQVVSIEDRLTLEEMQTSLTSVVMSIVSRLETEIHPLADRIMHLCLELLQNSGPKSSVSDTVLAAIGALVNAVGADFLKYMEAFAPFLYNALRNRDEPSLCAMSIGLVSDITRGLDDKVQPFCDQFMNLLLEDLQSPELGNQVKPAILQCFGDIAQAIGGNFGQYLPVVAQVLQQASQVPIKEEDGPEARDYVISLREGIMDAWDGAIIAMKLGGNVNELQQHVPVVMTFLEMNCQDSARQYLSDALIRSSMGVIGDLADAFPGGELAEAYRAEWILSFTISVRKDENYDQKTREVAKWAREQVKRQIGGVQGQMA